MVIADDGLDAMATIMAGGGALASHMAIGTGSSTVGSLQTTLLTETDRNTLSSKDNSIDKEVTYIADFGTSEMSGTTLREFGLFNSASGATMFQRVVVNDQTFDGTNELQIQLTHQYSQ